MSDMSELHTACMQPAYRTLYLFGTGERWCDAFEFDCFEHVAEQMSLTLMMTQDVVKVEESQLPELDAEFYF